MTSIRTDALRTLDLICDAAATMSFGCEAEVQGNGVRLNFSDDLVVVARINLTSPTIKFIATQFDSIPRHLVSEVCELIAMLNVSISIGYFALEIETREFRFYYDMPLEFGGDLRSAVRATLSTVVSNFRQIRPVAKMINDNVLSVSKALTMLQKPERDDADVALAEVCKIIEEMTDERDVIKVEKDRKQITITNHDDIGVAMRKTTIRVDPQSRTIFVLSVVPASGSEVARLVRETKLKFGSAKVDEYRRELIVSGAVKFGRHVRQQPFCDLLKEHFRSMRYIHNADMCP